MKTLRMIRTADDTAGEIELYDRCVVRPDRRRKRLAAQVWACLTWGRWLSLGLFLVALVAALWLKGHWI
ncbi:MAG: hypothetical protein ABSH34_21280 [Verrucomicrobiota bacterium]|jgi:hypothetical protein